MAKLQDGIGAAGAAQLFAKLGRLTGEDRFVSGNNPANNGVMSHEQAVARKAELIRDKDFVTRFNRGDSSALREMRMLDEILVGRF
jgi:hypothetical protein